MYQKKVGKFIIKSFFDKQRGKLINNVTFLRKQLPTQVLSDRRSLQYMGLELIKSDLLDVINWCNISSELLSNDNKNNSSLPILHSLFISIVTTYWKCFADTKGRHGAQLNDTYIASEYLPMHHELKRIRHNFTAHSGDDPFESGYLLLVKDLNRKNRFLPFTLPIHRKAANADLTMNQKIKTLATSLIEKIEVKQERLHKQIMESTV